MKFRRIMEMAVVTAMLCGCVKSPNVERIEAETKKGLEASWAGKGVTVKAVHLEPAGKDKYAGEVVVEGADWNDEVKIEVIFKNERISWTVDKWDSGK
ncbi:MAG: hypothetical protein K5787_02500 [Lentisphaeria bacterium]|nr:hypothetical protein [Victivallales bacterium]MBR6057701.1 hypothetical protein [Victivallales bacterium]MCR4572611.1 hypothetical protein [Lentisphaeria bacterium]